MPLNRAPIFFEILLLFLGYYYETLNLVILGVYPPIALFMKKYIFCFASIN